MRASSSHTPRIEIKFNPALQWTERWQATYYYKTGGWPDEQIEFASGSTRDIALSRIQKRIDRIQGELAAEQNKEIIEL